MINDSSRVYTCNNLSAAMSDFDAANMSRAVRTVFPAMTVADQSAVAQGLAAVEDQTSKYTGLWMRLLALSLSLSADVPTVNGLDDISIGQQIGLAVAGAPTAADILGSVDAALQGGWYYFLTSGCRAPLVHSCC